MARKRRRDQATAGDSRPSKKQQLQKVTNPSTYYYTSISDVPWDVQSYWRQRYSIFTKYDEGIHMTEGAWYGVTHECVAMRIAADIAAMAPSGRSIILDPFCGVGGNAIAFARSGRWKRVYAIEKDPTTLECARHNARIYGVHDKITWFQGDCFQVLGCDDEKRSNEHTVDALRKIIREYGVIFASPPWGGPGYKTQDVFDLSSMEPYNLPYLYKQLSKVSNDLALYLPRTSDLHQIAEVVQDGKTTQVLHYCTRGASRALCAYLGKWNTLKSP